ncbi:MAG TPA: hypothetical protein VNE39_08180 [Planctomycetota bacterium]|nr:hypothetical protein [Planctomycetota bacterium]
MPDEVRKRMEALLSSRSPKKAPPREEILKEDPRMVTFRQEFRRFCKNIVMPALVDAERLLKRHGHDCEVEEETATEIATGEKLALSARMRIFPAGWGRGYFQKSEPPYIWVTPDEANHKVRVLTGTALPGKERPPTANEYTLEQLNKEAIELEVLNVLQVILGEE